MSNPRTAKLKSLPFTYQGDGKGNIRFFYGAKPMWEGQVFKIDRLIARVFVDEMNALNAKEVMVIGGAVVDDFYAKVLEPTIPRTLWQRIKRWFRRRKK